MNKKALMFWLVMLLALLAFLWGCASYGKLILQRGEDKMTVEQLVQDWQSYNVLFAGVHRKLPSAVLSDRKDDNITVTGDRWFPVEDKDVLEERIHVHIMNERCDEAG